jgi:hypothetical protein
MLAAIDFATPKWRAPETVETDPTKFVDFLKSSSFLHDFADTD